MTIAFGLIIAIILVKFKPAYEVTISDQEVGYITDSKQFDEKIKNTILEQKGNNIDTVIINEKPSYELKLINRNKNTNEDEIYEKIKLGTTITYKYYAVTLENANTIYVDTLEEAEKVVNEIKEEHKKDLELNLQIIEKYTNNKDEIKTDIVEVAKGNLENEVEEMIRESKIPNINGIKLSAVPVSGRITSRYGERSRRRVSTHTGLDIACKIGTNIKAVADGTVVFSAYNGAYGNLVKINHSNGVETWYAHCNSLRVKKGEKVKAGDIIGTVGSTGNSTGPHLHFEIRLNNTTINPQKYLYN